MVNLSLDRSNVQLTGVKFAAFQSRRVPFIPEIHANSSLAFSTFLRYQPPMANDSIERLAKTLADTVPQGLRSVRDDLEKNFQAVLKSGLGKLDLVTREEFEVQEAVLARTREKLEALENRLAKIYAKPSSKKKSIPILSSKA